MLRIRMFEERLMQLKAEGEIPGSIHLCNGQEAIPVGAVSVLRDDDYVAATYRGHGWAISRGAALSEMFAEIMGRESALNGGRGGSPYLSDAAHNFLGENSIVGGGVPIAAGAALSAMTAGHGQVAVVSIGDGATNQGAVHETLNLAAVMSLPLVIVVENNLYSEMVRNMVRVEQLAERAASYGIPGVTIDGNDPLTVAHAVAHAVERARQGQGPTLIEAMTQRLVGHHSGDLQHYRPRGEVAEAAKDEPLIRVRNAVAADPEAIARLVAIDAEVADEVDQAVLLARTIPFPSPDTAKDHLYV